MTWTRLSARIVFRWVGAGLFSGLLLPAVQADRPVLLLGLGIR